MNFKTLSDFLLRHWQRCDDTKTELMGADIITIEGGQRGGRPELGKIMGELTLHSADPVEDKGQDLLDLMDSV